MVLDYYQAFIEAAKRHSDLVDRRHELEIEIAKLEEFLQVTFNMLSPEHRRQLDKEIEAMEIRNTGLKNAVLMALKARSDEWLTPPEIRDYLKKMSFDFSDYSADPLPSIATTLKRMIPDLVETAKRNGQMAYRLKTPGRLLRVSR